MNIEKTDRSRCLNESLKASFLAALVAFALSFLVLGVETRLFENKVIVVPHWNYVALIVLTVFVMRFMSVLFSWKRRKPSTDLKRAKKSYFSALFETKFENLLKIFGIALFIFAFFLPFFPFSGRYFLDLSILILTYTMLGWGLNVVIGLAGLLDLGYVAFYAAGAYSYALLSTSFFPFLIEQGYLNPVIMNWIFWICLPLSGISAALLGISIASPVLQLRGDYLAIVTLAFAEILRMILINWDELTGGPNGISRIPHPSFLGIEFNRSPEGFSAIFDLEYSSLQRLIFLYYLIFFLAMLTNVITLRLRRLPIGRSCEAMREDEIACRSLGIDTRNTKLTAFAIGAMFAGFAGSFFAARQGFISPESFGFMESALILSIVVLGGLGSQIGIVIASIVMVGGVQAARRLEFFNTLFGPDFDPSVYRMLLFGLVMVLIMICAPRGLISHRTPSILLQKKKASPADLTLEEQR
ncbi:MAG: high-affinity branched-chain amino acid ABC transporter permease LivM [Alphaproteobacteria bacterium]|nr:high-affinity branched-chain amino acid ABC transporter permease LivM [Alphaproteobacteria bacterium]